MNKYVFLFELRRELSFMTPDDKEAAAHYYEEYFAEAGPENERAVLAELGSAAKLAAELRREYEAGRPEPTGLELATGEEDRADGKSPGGARPNAAPGGPGAREPGDAPYGSRRWEESGGASRPWKNPYGDGGAQRPYGSRPPNRPPFGSYRYGRPADGARPAGEGPGASSPPPPGGTARPATGDAPKKRLPAWAIVLIVFAAIFLGPVVLGLLAALFAVLFAVCIALLCVGGAVIAAGIAAIVAGVWALGFVADALFLFGIGLIAIALGLPIFWLFIWLSVKLFSGTIRTLKTLWHKIRGTGGGSGE